MPRGRDCNDCESFARRAEFNHPACAVHRPCITRFGYEPDLCEFCGVNRGSWEPYSQDLARWRRELARHSNRMGGSESWPFSANFTSFFGVLLPADSDAGSRDRVRSPRQGRGSHSDSPFARNNTRASSTSSRDSRPPRSSRRDWYERAAGPRPRGPSRGHPRRSRSRSRRSMDRDARAPSSGDRAGAADPPAGPSGAPDFSESIADLRAQIGEISAFLRGSGAHSAGPRPRSASPDGVPVASSSRGRSRTPRRRRNRIISSSSSESSSSDDAQGASPPHAAGGDTPARSASLRKTNVRFEDLKGHSFSGSHSFFLFHPDLEVEDGRGVLLDGVWHPITRHPTAAAFRFNVSGVSRDMLVSPSAAQEAIRRAFSRLPTERARAGSAPRAITYAIEDLPVLQSLLSVLKTRDRALVKAVVDQEYTTFTKNFIDFKPLMGILFADGWNVCRHFEDFAKPQRLAIGDDALQLGASPTPFIPAKFLDRELEKRQILVDFLSSLAMFFKLAASLEGADTPMAQLTYTAIRGILPTFQLALFSWMSSKVDVRKIFLQGSSFPFAQTLISSSPWVPSLFPLDTVLELIKSPALQGKRLMQALGWSERKDSTLKQRSRDIDPRHPGLLPASTGIKRRLGSPPGHGPGPSTSFRSTKRQRKNPRQRRGDRQPFRGSKGSRRGRGASSSARGSAPKQSQA